MEASKVKKNGRGIKPELKVVTQEHDLSGDSIFLKLAFVVHILGLLFICSQVYMWGGSRVLNGDGSPRFAFQDAKGKVTGVPVEAGSLLRIALALESISGTGPTTISTSPLNSINPSVAPPPKPQAVSSKAITAR